MLNNLIGNAIKFTDTGGIQSAFLKHHLFQEIKIRVTIEVQDTGYGIAPEDQATIFERFRQGKINVQVVA